MNRRVVIIFSVIAFSISVALLLYSLVGGVNICNKDSDTGKCGRIVSADCLLEMSKRLNMDLPPPLNLLVLQLLQKRTRQH